MKQVWIPEKSEVPAVEVVDGETSSLFARMTRDARSYAEVMKGGL